MHQNDQIMYGARDTYVCASGSMSTGTYRPLDAPLNWSHVAARTARSDLPGGSYVTEKYSMRGANVRSFGTRLLYTYSLHIDSQRRPAIFLCHTRGIRKIEMDSCLFSISFLGGTSSR